MTRQNNTIKGFSSTSELEFLRDTARAKDVIVEIGSLHGRTAKEMSRGGVRSMLLIYF